jgi:hypothetical protein
MANAPLFLAMRNWIMTSANSFANNWTFHLRPKANLTFDCVQMMRDIRREVNNEISGMSTKQLLAYLQKARSEYQKAVVASERIPQRHIKSITQRVVAA